MIYLKIEKRKLEDFDNRELAQYFDNSFMKYGFINIFQICMKKFPVISLRNVFPYSI